MSYRICPRCSGFVEVRKLGKQFHVLCTQCGASHRTKLGEVNDPVAAYFRFMDIMEAGEPAQPAPVKSHRQPRIIRKEKSDPLKSKEEWQKHLKEVGIKNFKQLPDVLKRILSDPNFRLVRYRQFPETVPEPGASVETLPLNDQLKTALQQQGISELFKFQETALIQILAGKDVVISAPTATGKTEAFALPIIEQILARQGGWGPLRAAEGREVQAIFIYPTKALARDQAGKLNKLAGRVGLDVAVMDGDTPKAERAGIFRQPPDILITNPDMLHIHLISPRDPIRRLVRTARHVVLDELHVYVGAFGTNVHFLLRRLQRLCPPLQLIGASATVANAQEFTELLFGRSVIPVICDTAKRGIIHFLMLYPEGVSQSSMIATVAQELVQHDMKTLVFANTHKNAEVINLIARRTRLSSAVHRAGLPMIYRQKVEDAFRNGELDLLVSTPTLELGIDIGDLDSVVSMLVGITRLTQRIGRAGRKGQESVAVLALRANEAISTYYREHPDDYFTDIDAAYVEPHNEVVAHHQLLAAALDSPIKSKEFHEFEPILRQLIREQLLIQSNDIMKPDIIAARRALAHYSIRGIGDSVQIIHDGKIIGERQMPIAMGELHPGAFYLHAGHTYESLEFEYRHGVGRAVVQRLPSGHREMTQPMRHVNPEILRVLKTRQVYGMTVHYADLRMTEVVTGYVIKDIYTDKILKTMDLDEPLKFTYQTKGFFFTAPHPTKAVKEWMAQLQKASSNKESHDEGEEIAEEELMIGGFHALEHVLIESSDMLTGGGSQGIGGVSMGATGLIFIYDGSPGGSGLSKLLYDRLEEALRRASIIIQDCACEAMEGCPACTFSYRCGNNNSPLFKAGALEAAELILEGVQVITLEKPEITEEPLV
ncbi:MAG: DEAD/DEAH box helicase [Candidatus Hermodarchaeota archaeon]|nr:DEAD/DEAH box helicase [Candidatus Hermodarchaeota archaeon]